jgi:hypothetical protein
MRFAAGREKTPKGDVTRAERLRFDGADHGIVAGDPNDHRLAHTFPQFPRRSVIPTQVHAIRADCERQLPVIIDDQRHLEAMAFLEQEAGFGFPVSRRFGAILDHLGATLQGSSHAQSQIPRLNLALGGDHVET